MIDPDAQPQHPTPHSEETSQVDDADLEQSLRPGQEERHEADVDATPMRTPGGVNTEVDRIFGDDSER